MYLKIIKLLIINEDKKEKKIRDLYKLRYLTLQQGHLTRLC